MVKLYVKGPKHQMKKCNGREVKAAREKILEDNGFINF